MIGKNSKFFTKELISKLVEDIGVAFWVWEIEEDKFFYNDTFYKLIGYTPENDSITFKEFEDMIHPKDRANIQKAMHEYLSGAKETYSIEYRVLKENDEELWVYDVGKITKVNENGKPIQASGILHDISKRKEYENQLKKEENKLKLAMRFAGFSVWEWDIENNTVTYDNQYYKNLGYEFDEEENSLEKFANIIHPNDLQNVKDKMGVYLTQKDTTYDNKLRIRKANGDYIWVRDVGEVSKFDETGKPIQIIGGRTNIEELEVAKLKLEEYQQDLEIQIEQRTNDLLRRDKILLELNIISQKLMATPTCKEFNEIAYKYLEDFSSLQEFSRIVVFRNKVVDSKEWSYMDNNPKTPFIEDITIEYIREVFKDDSVEFLTEGKLGEDQRELAYEEIYEVCQNVDYDKINYTEDFPTIYGYVKDNKSLNMNTKEFTPKEYIFSMLQDNKSVLMSPIVINNQFWGYILIDSTKEDVFSVEDEKTLNLVGAVIAQAIHKNELELIANEAIVHNELMLNSNPLCCTLWKGTQPISVNDETVRLFGLDNKEDFNEKFYLLSPEYQSNGKNSAKQVEDNFKEVMEQGYIKFEWDHINLEGDKIPAEVILVKIPYQGDYLVAGYVRDLREYKALLSQMEETRIHLEQAHEEAMLSSQAKSNFLANMSHEIRTPMNAISGMTDIILRETTDTEVSEYAVNIKRACDSLLAIINDVLDISKIESGKLDIVEGKYKISQVLNDVITIATNRLELKPLMFTTNFQADIPDELIGDDTRIKQIMVNILNNAIKFTSEGWVSFDVSGSWAGGILELKISIEDTGSGISQEDMDKLFIEFERVNTKKNRNIEGTGLGLAISKRLCEMMLGNIEVESELGKGTKFTVTVMQKYDEYVPLAKVDEKKSILIFESREVYQKSLRQSCLDLGIEDVVFCKLQSEFSEALQEREFDYIFTSSMYLIKAQETLLRHELLTKIILLADSQDIKSKYDYITIVLPANAMSIANVLNGKVTSNTNNQDANNFTAPDCRILVVDDNSVNLKVAQGLMRPYKMTIDLAENGLEAVEKIKETQYDLVFMDHMMPIMDGIDATIEIRALNEEYYQKLPIIALTANAIIGTKEMFINEGMNDFLAKPIKLSALNDILSKWLPIEKQITFISGVNNDVESVIQSPINIANINTGLGIQSVGGDVETYLDILNMYYKDGVKRIPNIESLYDDKKLLDFKIEVHALKSASASVGALGISEKAKKLEEASIKEDWDFINHNTLDFINSFNILLEDIREALKGLIATNDTSDKELGDDGFYIENMNKLIVSLDEIDVNESENIIKEFYNFNWSEEKLELLNQVKEFVDSYEFDDALELIKKYY